MIILLMALLAALLGYTALAYWLLGIWVALSCALIGMYFGGMNHV